MNKGLKFFLILLLLAALFMVGALLLLPRMASREETALSTATVQTEETDSTQESSEDTGEEDAAMAQAKVLLADMTLREKLCQLMIVSPDTLTGVSPTVDADARTKQALQDYPVGGFYFSQENIQTRAQTVSLLSGLQSQSELGLLLCVDEEGGDVWRVMGNSSMGVPRLDSMYSYKDAGGETAFRNAETIATALSQLGFNVDFAPVADVWSNPDNTVIGTRAYSDSYSQAAALISQAVSGFHAGGVACTLKHFPGHGGTEEDSHDGTAVVTSSLNDLSRQEMKPFRTGIAAGADLVMIGHLMVTSVDTVNPAPFSYRLVTEILREKTGFDGVVITDALGMGALADYTEAESCRKALLAGCDLLLGVTEPEQTLAALTEDVENGTLTEARIDESVLRVLTLKIDRGIISAQDTED